MYEGNIKSVNFLNNTINANNGDGFYFYTRIGVTNVTDFIIRGNTIFATNAGLNFTGLSVGSLVNVTVEYNRILASFGVNITGHNDNSSFDRNWWGVNDITGMILGVDTLNHFILNITNTSGLDGVHFGDNVSFMLLVLNTTLSNDGVEFLPDFVVNGTFNGADFNSSRVDGFVYNATATAGVQTLAATLDNVDDTVAFNAQLTTNSSIIVSNDPVSIGNNVTISGQLDNFTGIAGVNVTVDGNLYTDVSVNGTGGWNFNYTTNRTGTITFSVNYAGNENYTAFTNSTSFEVLRNSTNSSIIVSSVQIGTNANITGELVGYVGNGSDSLTVSVDGNVYNNVTINSTGGWSLNYTTNRTGNITVSVNYVGNDNYTGFTNASSFTVNLNDTNSSIVVNPETVNIGNNVTISGQLEGYVGNGSDSLTVSVDGNVYNDVIINSTGVWSLNYTTNRTGNINVSVTYVGNENYTGFTNASSFTVNLNDTNSSIVVNPDSVNIGNNVTISGELVGYVGNGSDSLTVSVDGNVYNNVIINSTGGWSLNYTTNRTGNITVNVTYAGNDNYTSFTNSTSFEVLRNSTNSSIIVASVQIGTNAIISGELVGYVGNGSDSLTVSVDGNVYDNIIINSTGGWSLNYTTNRTGNIIVNVNYVGNENYTSFTNVTSFLVAKNGVNSSINIPSNIKVEDSIIIDGVLADENGNPIANTTITVIIDGENFNVTTAENGSWNINYTPTHAGDFNINVTWEGNENYTSFTNNTNFNVNKLATYSSIDLSADFRVGKTTVISGVLLDEEDNTIADSELEITIDGKKHLVKTNFNGYWYLTYKPKSIGKITVVLNFNGDAKYLGFTNSTSFDVKKGESFVNVTVNENKDGSVDLIVKVVDEDGDTIPDYKVDVELDGKYIGSVITDSDGVGIFHIPNSKLKTGKHKITALSDNENYFSNLTFAEFETKNNNNTNNTNNTNGNDNKTTDNPVAIATMKKTGIPIIAIILVLISIFGISLRRKQ
ncbi:adhesin-like protein [Methanobrevibacter arboriphilus JCM 13429 = DSM 1125]|uniref:Adhesin-like protein n=1 Tax=Methanobrevibacter arboriphilus JCM 13429 = DSM 1125 TaxID=1300164 RepID=A0A1V6N135_METAZ|nr:adhesin-like protein [Methanobrevibacter arboriphilus JCM 13429 = DSM 1125]